MNTKTVAGGLVLMTGMALAGCTDPMAPTDHHRRGLLSARPHTPTGALFQPGRHTLDLGLERNPVLYVPEGHDPSQPAPLVVLFHGAGGSADDWVSPYAHADRLGLVLLLMQSRHGTWDLTTNNLGPDVVTLDRALARVFDRCAIDPVEVAFGGFSDGASYTLSIGVRNAELVRHLIAFSPGYITGRRKDPKPRVFISHGTLDIVLPATGARTMVEELRADGYDVTYLEFFAGHEVPAEVSRAAFDWLAGEPGSSR